MNAVVKPIEPEDEAFAFRGSYRVQSRVTPEDAALAGRWYAARQGCVTERDAQAYLALQPEWRGFFRVSLRPASMQERRGAFGRCPDILYKKSNFRAAPGTRELPANIIDVDKATQQWGVRRACVASVLGTEAAARWLALVPHVGITVANEYYLHELGHGLGYDVETKSASGHYCWGDVPTRALIYLEELRADLHAFAAALELLDEAGAVSILAYNVALRFGVHIEGVATRGVAPYGLIPFLLFAVLVELGIARVVDGYLVPVARFGRGAMRDAMRRCGEHARTQLTGVEMRAATPFDAAKAAAIYVRRRVTDESLARPFGELTAASVARWRALNCAQSVRPAYRPQG